MARSNINRSIVRVSAMTFVLAFTVSAIASAQAPGGVRCADGFLATTAAVCDKGHRGVVQDLRSVQEGQGTSSTAPGTDSGHTQWSEVVGFSQGMSQPAQATRSNSSGGWGAYKEQVQPSLTRVDTTGKSGGAPSYLGATSLPPGVVIPPPDTTTTAQPKGKSP